MNDDLDQTPKRSRLSRLGRMSDGGIGGTPLGSTPMRKHAPVIPERQKASKSQSSIDLLLPGPLPGLLQKNKRRSRQHKDDRGKLKRGNADVVTFLPPTLRLPRARQTAQAVMSTNRQNSLSFSPRTKPPPPAHDSFFPSPPVVPLSASDARSAKHGDYPPIDLPFDDPRAARSQSPHSAGGALHHPLPISPLILPMAMASMSPALSPSMSPRCSPALEPMPSSATPPALPRDRAGSASSMSESSLDGRPPVAVKSEVLSARDQGGGLARLLMQNHNVQCSPSQFFSSSQSVARQSPLLFVQLPTHLPITSPSVPAGPPANPNHSPDDAKLAQNIHNLGMKEGKIFSNNSPNSILHIPPGHLGTLVLYKSGKVKFQLGAEGVAAGEGLVLQAAAGIQPSSREDVVVLAPETKCCYELGSISERLVFTLDPDDVISKPEAVQQAEKVAGTAASEDGGDDDGDDDGGGREGMDCT